MLILLLFSSQTDVRFNAGRFEYLVKQKDASPNQIVPSAEALPKWPGKVAAYLQKRVNIQGVDGNVVQPKEVDQPIGAPIKISCKDFIISNKSLARFTSL